MPVNDTTNQNPGAMFAAGAAAVPKPADPLGEAKRMGAYGQYGDVGRYAEVYNRPGVQTSDPNKGVYLWGDDANRTAQDAYNAFLTVMGRDPNQVEFSQIMGAFQGPNSAVNGRAYLAQLKQEEERNPQNPNGVYNPNNPNNRLGQYHSAVATQFQQILGRAPTSDELNHFAAALATNQTDTYGLSSFLKQMPEYTNAQDKQFRSGVNDELAGYDEKAFGRMKGDIYADYASRGINVGGNPSLDFALTDLMGKIAENRQKYLTTLSASQYGGNKELATGNYRNVLDQMYQQNQSQRQGNSAYGQQLLNQGWQGADYGYQMRDYNNMMNPSGRNTLHTGDWINLGLGAANTGAKAYGAAQGGGNPYGYLNG